ncbi:Putative major facilitator superfamily (MFS) transporter [Sinomonas atrocyanea]|uniref:Lysosomal dipeptide transporter MFSD1 n=1 Tax=Sinomonas atrocyanea TaxID=37927 RepID=A0A126ZZJ2_9MICC|nr:MFS transporter [Sinomonas atrocyanea]AMM32523.1 Putative major facilitator superfamily (MFS) transporter [Sinomonas atrocyanea]GEB62561.1 MFS transporter [Sinomonas atrocyanea]GGG80204.1 MFS transporter [Sinomonas atrocyanea]
MNSWRAYVVWGIGVFGYLVAVLQRTSFGVVGLEAAERFHVGGAVLSAFTVLQLVVYASLQIPVGLLVDRFGSRIMVSAGAVFMALGQLQIAVAETTVTGIIGRMLVGMGDAMTFVSVLRLVPLWFDGRRAPLMSQLTGVIGQLGQLVSVIPFLALLHAAGWSQAFMTLAALSLVVIVLVLALLRNAPAGAPAAQSESPEGTRALLAAAWRQPGTRLGMWSHFTVQFSGNVFALMWGFPFMVAGQGFDSTVAAGLMSFFVAVAILAGPPMGRFVARHPLRRSTLVLGISTLTALAWTAVLVVPGRAPLWLMAVLVAVLALGGPASMIGFDFARTFNPSHRLGTATGIVNIGGFVAALLTMFLVGYLLDLQHALGLSPQGVYSLDAFRVALAVQLLVLGAGAFALVRVRRKVRRALAAQNVRVPLLRELWADYRARRRR